MPDSPELIQAIETAVRCINAKKKSRTHHLNYDEVRGLAVGLFQEIRRGNTEATLIDGVGALLRRDCPELFKKEPEPVSQSKPKPKPEPKPKNDEEILLRRFYRMKVMESLQKKMSELDDYMYKWQQRLNKNEKQTAIHRKLREEVYIEHYNRAQNELDELGGQLSPDEVQYAENIPNLKERLTKLKMRGLGKHCSKCGLPKKK